MNRIKQPGWGRRRGLKVTTSQASSCEEPRTTISEQLPMKYQYKKSRKGNYELAEERSFVDAKIELEVLNCMCAYEVRLLSCKRH
jgi:hypothetical protein